MEYISSDPNIRIDFLVIDQLTLPFLLHYKYIMNKDAIEDELLSPEGLGQNLLMQGLEPVELTLLEFELAESYGPVYPKLSRFDRIALAIAKERNIKILTGDKALRKAATLENVPFLGTLGIIDQLLETKKIDEVEYIHCLQRLDDKNGKKIRLPKNEITKRLEARSSKG